MSMGEEPQDIINEEDWHGENDRINQAILFDPAINLPNENHHINAVILGPLIPVPTENELHVGMLVPFVPLDRPILPVIVLVQDNEKKPEHCPHLPDRVRHAAVYAESIGLHNELPILGRFVYYSVIHNGYDQVMILINANNGHEFLKAYRRTTNVGTLESPMQAVERAFNEHIQVKKRTTGEIYGHVDFNNDVLSAYNYLQYVSPSQHVHIGLFICYINMNMWAFTPRHRNIFQNICFVPIREVPERMTGYDRAIFQNLPRD